MLGLSVFVLAMLTTVAHSARSSSRISAHDREHLQSHASGQLDLSLMSEEELRFLYFQSHDFEANQKLDGCELIQSMLHFQSEESVIHGRRPRSFTDAELSMMVDPIMESADLDRDGFIDYQEFVAGPGMISF